MNNIQNLINNQLIIKKFNNFINIIIENIIINKIEFNDFFIKNHKIYKLYSPSKNENKFIFGILLQKSLIEFLNKIFYKCIDLDDLKNYGSNFLNDCLLCLTKYIYFPISIKAKSKKNGANIIIINYHSKKMNYNLENLITFIIIIEINTLYILPHNIIDKKFIINNDSNLSYKCSLLTYIDINYKNFKIILEKNTNFNNFILNEYPLLKPFNIYNDLYDKL